MTAAVVLMRTTAADNVSISGSDNPGQGILTTSTLPATPASPRHRL
jgi:hypothetical protein